MNFEILLATINMFNFETLQAKLIFAVVYEPFKSSINGNEPEIFCEQLLAEHVFCLRICCPVNVRSEDTH